jgi:hypothetical protein
MKRLLIGTYRLAPLPLRRRVSRIGPVAWLRRMYFERDTALHDEFYNEAYHEEDFGPTRHSAPAMCRAMLRHLGPSDVLDVVWHRRVPRGVPRCRRARSRRRTGDRGAGAVPGQGAGGRPGRPIEGAGVALDRRPGLQLRSRRAHPRGGCHRVRRDPDRRGEQAHLPDGRCPPARAGSAMSTASPGRSGSASSQTGASPSTRR